MQLSSFSTRLLHPQCKVHNHRLFQPVAISPQYNPLLSARCSIRSYFKYVNVNDYIIHLKRKYLAFYYFFPADVIIFTATDFISFAAVILTFYFQQPHYLFCLSANLRYSYTNANSILKPLQLKLLSHIILRRQNQNSLRKLDKYMTGVMSPSGPS